MKISIALRKIYLVILTFLLTFSLKSQSKFTDIAGLKTSSDSLNLMNENEKADKIYFEAEEYFRERNEWDDWYKIILLLRDRQREINNLSGVINIFTKYEKFVPDSAPFTGAKMSYQKGYFLTKMFDYHNAIKENKKALKLIESISNKTQMQTRMYYILFVNLSINYSRLGDQKSAINYCNDIIKYCVANEMDDKLCELYINKGQFSYYDHNYENAFRAYSKAKELCNSKTTAAFLYISIAELFLEQNKLERSKEYLTLAQESNLGDNDYFSRIYSIYLFKNGDYTLGKAEIEKAIKLFEIKKDAKNLIKSLVIYSEKLFEANEKEEAIWYAHKAISKFYESMDTSNIFERPKISDKIPYTYIIEALNIKAKYFRDKYLETNDQFSLIEATFYFDLLLSHFDKLKSEYYSSTSQYRLGAYSQKIYSKIITFYVDQNKKKNNIKNIESAFSLAQRANSFVLRNAVSDRKALELAGVKQDSLEEYLQLTLNASSDIKQDSTSDVKALMEFDAFKESLLLNYPSYGKYDKEEEISIKEIQSSLDSNSLILKYYYFKNVLTVFGIAKHSTFAENIPLSEELDSIIHSNSIILSQNIDNDSLANYYMTNSKKVYDHVLGELLTKYNLNSINHLTIIPDGPLKKVAFNALAIDDSVGWNDPNAFLISKYSVNYLYYCSQLKSNNKNSTSKNGFIGFGIEYKDDFLQEVMDDYMSGFKINLNNSRTTNLSPLKYADDEVIASAEILDGTHYTNSKVTPSQVFSTINNFDIVHFSAHAFVDEDDYLNSFVVLNKDEDENYQFKYSDILNLDLDSELVVLSACQTNSGKNVVGEGLMSLSRAFVQSGSDAAVGAYWNAPDYATKELMTLFYSNLKEGMPKSKAIQQAQIEYLTNDNISSPTIRAPFFWAAWAIYGNDQPLKITSTFFNFKSWEPYGLLVVIGLLLLFLVKYFSKK